MWTRLVTGLGLLLIAVWVCARMQPAVELWREMLAIGRPGVPSLAFASLAAVLGVPMLHALSAATFVAGSLASLMLLIVRSTWFGRVLLAGTLMQGALVFAGAAGNAVAERNVLSVGVAIHATRSREPMLERHVVEQVQRYRDVTSTTTTTLMWTWAASALLTSTVFTGRLLSVAVARAP